MASILRSSKFVRYIAGFARNIVVNTPREFDGSIVNSSTCLCGAIPRSLATQVQHDQTLDSCLRRLDQDVRRTGRISRRDIEDVLEEIRHTRSPTSSQSLLVIRCCGNLVPEELPETRTKLVQEIWNTLNKLNVPMDISHYNALLRVYLENEHEFTPTDILAELEAKGIEPNRVTYQRLIAKYCQSGDIEGATRILEFMREKQLPVNENVFNALIDGHSKTGDMESAHGILAVMLQAGLDPSADTYTILMSGYAKQGDMETIKMLLEECDKKEIFLLDKDYLEIAYSLTINGHEALVPEILTKVKKQFGYNQDAINVIFRLINKGFDDTAFTIMRTMVRNERTDGTQQSMGAFFLKQMVKANRPIEKILDVCKRLEEEELFVNPISYITERALELGNETVAYELLHKMKEQGLPIRNHYFWPLIISKANDPTGDGIIDVLIEMGKFDVHPNAETIREYVLPNLKGKSSDIISKLRTANISIGSAACSLAISLIQRFDLAEAAVIMQTVQAYYQPDLLRKPLTAAFYKTKDVENYITIVRQVYENMDKKADFDNDDKAVDKSPVVGRFIMDLASHGRQFNDVVIPVLEALIAQGLSISTSVAEKVQERIGEKMTPEISAMLARLSSGELIPSPIERKPPAYVPSSQMNIPQLEMLIKNLTAKGQDTKGMKRQLLNLYYRNKELEKMEALYAELESSPDFQHSTGVYAQLLDTCAFHEKYDETMKYLKRIEESNPEFRLDDAKVVRVATVMVKNDKLNDAVEFLKRPREIREERNFMFNSLCWRLLNYLADQGNVDDLQLVFDTMLQNGYLEMNNIILGPLVKVHIVNKDINKALEKFEWCCNQFRATPWKNELACQLIQAEDAERLQKLTDLSTAVHGEINSLYDLVFAFVECGRVRQARKILETPGLQSRPQRINVACQRYREEGMIQPLEGLCEATKDLNHIDRSDIYYQLLLSYTKQNDVVKAEQLWTQMQEEDITPTDQFLNKLGNFLIKNNITPPFVVPQIATIPKSSNAQQKSTAQNTQPSQPVAQPKKIVTIFRNCVKAGDVDKALEIRKTTDEPLTATDISLLIEKLVQNNRSNEATALTIDALEKGLVPITRVFRFLLNKLANSGDVTSIETIGSKLDSELKKIVSFDNRICHANLIAGKAEDYLKMLEVELDNAKEQDLELIGEKFPRGGAVGILERHPELLEKYEELSFKYAKRGIIAPVNVLWSHYFINDQPDKADKVWKEYLEGAPRIMFQRVVQHAREVNDEKLTEKLIQHLKTSKVTEGALGNAYSCYLDVLVNKEKHEEVVKIFETALKSVSVDFINRTAVLRVKESFEKLGKEFNHTIPPKHKTPGGSAHGAQESSSSSSSDDDLKKNASGK